ncbi:hypothetical protein MKX03_027521 [Papaver bracteatum]|nr:hypothetical protein MKX03_027521 [Papaver bracteatum]
MLNQMDDDDDETEEEESSVSNEGWNSNQSNESILVDETSATEDGNNNNNNSSITSFSQEDLEQAIHIFMQMMQNQQGTTDIPAVRQLRINNEDGSVRAIISAAVRLLNSNVGSSEYGMSYEELMERIRGRIGIVQRGLSKETISSHLKTRVHTTFADLTEEETEICTICQDEYENKVKIATLDCQHEYHEDCITKWLVRKNVCPICNRQGLNAMEEC